MLSTTAAVAGALVLAQTASGQAFVGDNLGQGGGRAGAERERGQFLGTNAGSVPNNGDIETQALTRVDLYTRTCECLPTGTAVRTLELEQDPTCSQKSERKKTRAKTKSKLCVETRVFEKTRFPLDFGSANLVSRPCMIYVWRRRTCMHACALTDLCAVLLCGYVSEIRTSRYWPTVSGLSVPVGLAVGLVCMCERVPPVVLARCIRYVAVLSAT